MKIISSNLVSPSLIAKELNAQIGADAYSGAMIFVSADIDFESLLPLLSIPCPYIGTTTLTMQHGPGNPFSTCVLVLFDDSYSPSVGLMSELSNIDSHTAFAFSTADENIQRYCDKSSFSGGLAADNWEFQNMAVFLNGQVLRSGTVGIKLQCQTDTTAFCGWESIPGTSSIITSVSNGRVLRIDDQTAVEWYKKFVPATGAFGAYPIQVVSTKEYRAPLSVNEDDGSIAFSANLDEGTKISLTTTNRDKVMAATKLVVDDNKSNYSPAIMFSCAARSLVLGELADTEHDLHRNPESLTVYLYGEFVPNQKSTTLQNQHVVYTAFKEH